MKAVLSAGGWGTRFFPIAKTVSKCLLPVMEKPIIQYIVEECVDAGVDEIVIVVPEGPLGAQIGRHFGRDPEAENYFRGRGWADRYEAVRRLPDLADLTFVRQPMGGRYGTAVPPLLAREFVGDDDFLLINCDDLLLRFDGGSDLADLLAARDSAGAPAAVAATVMGAERAARYGVLISRDTAPRTVAELLDKPGVLPPGRYDVTVGRAVLPAEFLAYVDAVECAPDTGELAVTDAFAAYARSAAMVIHRVTGAYHDCGEVGGWLAANMAMAGHRGLEAGRC